MSRQDKSPNWLLVEGEEDKRVIPHLMEANGIPWKKQEEPVFIRECGGYQNIDSTLLKKLTIKELPLSILILIRHKFTLGWHGKIPQGDNYIML